MLLFHVFRYINDLHNYELLDRLFLNNQCSKYLKETSPKRQVIDFIAGMTDDLFHAEITK